MVNSNQLNESGYGKCRCCLKKKFVSELRTCPACGHFTCNTCFKGQICKKCSK